MSHPKIPGQNRLVISRREGERVLLGSGIEVRILKIGRSRARILFVVPDGLPVLRPGHEQDAKDRAENSSPPVKTYASL